MFRRTAKAITIDNGDTDTYFGPFLPGEVWRYFVLASNQGFTVLTASIGVLPKAQGVPSRLLDSVPCVSSTSGLFELPVWHRFDGSDLYAFVRFTATGVLVPIPVGVWLAVQPVYSSLQSKSSKVPVVATGPTSPTAGGPVAGVGEPGFTFGG